MINIQAIPIRFYYRLYLPRFGFVRQKSDLKCLFSDEYRENHIVFKGYVSVRPRHIDYDFSTVYVC